MSMYNLIEYNDSYSDTLKPLWQFKIHESPLTNTENPENVSTISFKYKSSFTGKSTADNNNRVFKNVKIAVPL